MESYTTCDWRSRGNQVGGWAMPESTGATSFTLPGWAVAAAAVVGFVLASFISPRLLAVLLFLPSAAFVRPLFDFEFGKVKVKWGPVDWFFMLVTFLIIVALING